MTNLIPKVEKHAGALEQLASAMEADGIGGNPSRGHAAVLRNMAGDLRSQAALGRMPSTFDAFHAAADQGDESGALRALRQGGALTLLQAVNAAADDPTRLTALVNLRARALRIGVVLDDDTILTLPALNAALDASGARTQDRFALKSDLHRAGLLAA
jgi:hypothetical protein